MPSSKAARTKIDEKSFENRRKSSPNRPKIDEKSILDRFGRPRPLQGRVRMRLGRLLGTQMPPLSRSWGALGSPRMARSRPKASPGQPRDALRARGAIPKTSVSAARIAQRSWKRLRINFQTFSVDPPKLRIGFRIGFYGTFSMSDVLRVERLPHAKTSKKQSFQAPKSRPGASWGPSGEQVRAPKRPSRAKKLAESTSRASAN